MSFSPVCQISLLIETKTSLAESINDLNSAQKENIATQESVKKKINALTNTTPHRITIHNRKKTRDSSPLTGVSVAKLPRPLAKLPPPVAVANKQNNSLSNDFTKSYYDLFTALNPEETVKFEKMLEERRNAEQQNGK